MRFRIRAEAADDLLDARQWYDAQSRGLGAEFLRAFWAVAELIERFPEAFPAVHRHIRRALMSRFPYAVYYQRVDDTTIEVLACLHTRRHPQGWPRA